MAVGMNDTNNDLFGDRMANHSLNGRVVSDGLGCLTQSLHNCRLEQTFGETNGLRDHSLDRQCPHNVVDFTNDYSSSNGFYPRNEFHSDRSGQTNGWNGDEWNNSRGFDSNIRPGMRAIRKQSESDSKSDDEHKPHVGGQKDGWNIREKDYKDWYHVFVEQTQRFAKMNGNSDKKSPEKHVHFENENGLNNDYNNNRDDHYWDRKSDQTFKDNSFKSFNDSNGFNDFGFNSNGSDSDTDYLPRMSGNKGSIVEALYHNILKPVAANFDHESNYRRQKWDQNVAQVRTSLSNNPLFGNSIWGNSNNQQNSIHRFFGLNSDDGKSKLANLLDSNRKAIPKTIAPNYTWSGQLPRRIRTKTPVYSCKVFLGGIPYDLTDSDLHCTFAQFGHIQIQWPGKDIRSAIEGAAANKAGYVYIIFENYDNVSALLNSCTISYRDYDSGCRWYYNISSRRQKSKEVQVIPFDIGDRFFMKTTFSGQMDHSRTVFVGALHGMLAADGLAKVMDDLFGGVIYAGLDTDKYKYPLGSGRVSFDNQDSYLKAVSAAFVEIKSARFKKKIQIDPYIEGESQCVVCRQSVQNPIYCRDEGLYFCQKCWESHHSDPESANHRPIMKNKSSKV